MCDCDVCVYGRKVMERIRALPEADREFFENLYERYCNESMDRDYYLAIVTNAWPRADEILARYRS